MQIRRVFIGLMAATLALTLHQAAHAQFGGVKGVIERQLDNAEQVHDEQIRQADQGTDPNGQPKPAAAADSGWIEVQGADPNHTKVRVYVAHPNYAHYGAVPRLPALLLLHDKWGLDDEMTQRSDEFAGKGFYTVAVDLFEGKTTHDAKEADGLKAKLTDAAALLRSRTGLNFISDQATKGTVDTMRIGAIGWGVGGEQALKLAVADIRIHGVADFYGAPVSENPKFKSLRGPVLGVFGNEDQDPSAALINEFDINLRAAGAKYELHRYDNAGHGFASKSYAAAGQYQDKPALDAYAKLDAWLVRTFNVKIAGVTDAAATMPADTPAPVSAAQPQ